MFLAGQALKGAWQEYGLFLLETLAALAVIALAAYAFVRLSERGFIRGRRGERMKVIERLVLEPRRSLHMVRVDKEILLIGSSEHSMELIKSLGSDDDGHIVGAEKAEGK